MMGDEEFDGRAILIRRAEAKQDLAGDAAGSFDVIVSGAFTDIVQQEREAKAVRIGNFGEESGKAAIGDGLERSDGDDAVFIDRVAMIKIADDQAIDESPLRDQGGENSGLLHRAQSGGGMGQR